MKEGICVCVIFCHDLILGFKNNEVKKAWGVYPNVNEVYFKFTVHLTYCLFLSVSLSLFLGNAECCILHDLDDPG